MSAPLASDWYWSTACMIVSIIFDSGESSRCSRVEITRQPCLARSRLVMAASMEFRKMRLKW